MKKLVIYISPLDFDEWALPLEIFRTVDGAIFIRLLVFEFGVGLEILTQPSKWFYD